MATKVELTDQQYQEILKNINKNSDIVNKEEFKEAVSEKTKRENPELTADNIKEYFQVFLNGIKELVDSQRNLYDELKKSGASRKELSDQSNKLKTAEQSYEQIKKLVSGLMGEDGEDEKKGEATSKALLKTFAPSFVSNTISAFTNGPLGVIQSILGVISKGVSTLSSGVKEAVNLSSSYLGKIDARLNGLREESFSYYSYFRDMSSQFNTSQYLSQKELTQNLAKLVDQGISRDLEQRALLETIKDKVVTTFDSMDASLTRLVRIQQQNITGIRMGSEAELTKFFNATFKDTSYLNSLYDSVNAAILDAEATLSSTGASAEFNYTVQKWLGSLYSAGVSESAISNIAQGLNALATGNINQLSNSSVGNLFALSAREAGLSYTDILTEGLNQSNVNALLEAMVLYLQQIANQTTGNVAKSAIYGAVGGGVSFSDIAAIRNINPSLLSSISASQLSEAGMIQSLQQNVGSLVGRTTAAERIQNLKDNILLGFGDYILGTDKTSDDAVLRYAAWNLADTFGGTIGDAVQTLWALPYAWDVFGSVLGDFSHGQTREEKIAALGVSDNMGIVLDPDVMAKYTAKLESDYISPGSDTMGKILSLLGFDSSGNYSPDFSKYIGGSVMSGVSFSSSGSEMNAYGRNYSQNQPTATSQTGYVGSAKTISDLYAELFESQQTPIRVSIAKLEDSAKSDLGIGPNGLEVDVNNNDVNNIVNAVSSIRMMF